MIYERFEKTERTEISTGEKLFFNPVYIANLSK